MSLDESIQKGISQNYIDSLIDDTRKETAKEILQKLIEKQHKRLLAWEYGEGYLDCMKDLKEVINEFGVEVEE